MYPHERSLVTRYKDQPFAIVGVNSDKSLETLQDAMKRNELTWTSFFDGGGTNGPIAIRWGVRGWPTIYVIDAEGVIRAKDVRGDALDAALAALLEGAKPAPEREESAK